MRFRRRVDIRVVVRLDCEQPRRSTEKDCSGCAADGEAQAQRIGADDRRSAEDDREGSDEDRDGVERLAMLADECAGSDTASCPPSHDDEPGADAGEDACNEGDRNRAHILIMNG